MPGEERWGLVEVFLLSREEIVFWLYLPHAPYVLSLNWLDFITVHITFRTILLKYFLGYWTSAFCSFSWPNLNVFKYLNVFSWYGSVFNKPACRMPGLAGKWMQLFCKIVSLLFERQPVPIRIFSKSWSRGNKRRLCWLCQFKTWPTQAEQELDNPWPFFVLEIVCALLQTGR